MTTATQPTCAERIKAKLESRMEDMRAFVTLQDAGIDVFDYIDPSDHDPDDFDDPEAVMEALDLVEDLGAFHEYGLHLDYVEPNTFEGQHNGYIRYQLSWGGPSDEFRFYVDVDREPYRIEYVFMDWFDGAKRTLDGKDERIMRRIFEIGYFEGCLDNR